MKNKFRVIIFLAFVIFALKCNETQAMIVYENDVPANSYIVGNHMFTDEMPLTTKHIMLAAKTIEGDNLSDMVIYYKTPRGKWIDGLSGSPLDVKSPLTIRYINTKFAISEPIIALNKEVSADKIPNTKDLHSKKYTLNIKNINDTTGIEIYWSDKKDGEYKVINEYLTKSLVKENENEVNVEVIAKGGYNNYYKVRTYLEYNGEKKYSNYSFPEMIDNTFISPTSSGIEKTDYNEYIPKEQEDKSLDTIFYLNKNSLKTTLGNIPEGIEIYSSLEEKGEYTLLKKVPYADLIENKNKDGLGFTFACNPNKDIYFKIRNYTTYGDNEIIYSDYETSHSFIGRPDLKTPIVYDIKYPVKGEESKETTPVELYLDDVYRYFGKECKNKVSVYYSTEKEGTYKELVNIDVSSMEEVVAEGHNKPYKTTINVPAGKKYFIKLQNYVEYENISNHIDKFSEIKEIQG